MKIYYILFNHNFTRFRGTLVTLFNAYTVTVNGDVIKVFVRLLCAKNDKKQKTAFQTELLCGTYAKKINGRVIFQALTLA